MIRPRQEVLEWLLEQAQTVPSYDGSDQGFLNTVFGNWWQVSSARLTPSPAPTHQCLPALNAAILVRRALRRASCAAPAWHALPAVPHMPPSKGRAAAAACLGVMRVRGG